MGNKNVAVPAPMIVDSNRSFLEELQASSEAVAYPPVLAISAAKAQIAIADHSIPISAIFINPNIGLEGTISVIRFTHFHRPTTAIYIISEGYSPFDDEESKRLGIEKFLMLPMVYAEFKTLASPVISVFDINEAFKIADQNADEVDAQVIATDDEFFAIKAAHFTGGTKSAFDIYIRLSSGKFIKLIQAGDAFSLERVIEYIKKGIVHFYLRKEAQEIYLSYCDRLAEGLLNRKELSMRIKTSKTLQHGQQTIQFLQDNGITADNIQYAHSFVGNVTKLVQQLNPGEKPLLNGFLNDLTSYDHGVATAMVAAMLIKTLDITSSDPTESVGMASLLHDIGLYKLGIAPDATEEEMTEDQKLLYYNHPIEGARLLENIGVKPVVLQGIEQHHERRNRRGFPLKVGAGNMSMVSEIVGMSDEFSTIVSQVKKDPKIDLTMQIQIRIFGSFSAKLITQFKKIFPFSDQY